MNTCEICVERINNKANAKITCISCGFECCKSCFRRYITDAAHYFQCMSCKIEFDRASLHKRLGATFMKNEYKYIREIMLFEIEKGLFPATQLIIEKEKAIEALENELSLVQDKYLKYQNDKQNEITEFCNSTKQLPIKEAINKYISLIHEANVDEKIQEETSAISANIAKMRDGKNTLHKTFIRKCPGVGCSGMLSKENRTALNNFRCVLCNSISCQECREMCINESTHECSKEILETIKFIDESSKPCPSCASPIHKLAGCFDKNTIIPLYNGINKFANEIQCGDILIGNDFQPRTVLDLFRGIDQLFQVDQENGQSYVVNSKHNLALIKKNGSKWIIDISTYINLSDAVKETLFGYKVSKDGETILSKLTISPTKIDNYYGFAISDNNKFLFQDNTVLSNCDQMWCVSCNTAFNWKTLRIMNGTIHNPHYFEFMRRNGQQVRDPLDIQCGREITHQVVTFIQRHIDAYNNKWNREGVISEETEPSLNENIALIYTLMERIIHLHRWSIPRLQATNIFNRNRNLRLQLLRNQIDETNFKVRIQRTDKAESKKRDMLNIMVTFRDCASEITFRLHATLTAKTLTLADLKGFIQEFCNLKTYIDECLIDTTTVYNSISYTSILDV